jgi:hypothetical protein
MDHLNCTRGVLEPEESWDSNYQDNVSCIEDNCFVVAGVDCAEVLYRIMIKERAQAAEEERGACDTFEKQFCQNPGGEQISTPNFTYCIDLCLKNPACTGGYAVIRRPPALGYCVFYGTEIGLGDLCSPAPHPVATRFLCPKWIMANMTNYGALRTTTTISTTSTSTVSTTTTTLVFCSDFNATLCLPGTLIDQANITVGDNATICCQPPPTTTTTTTTILCSSFNATFCESGMLIDEANVTQGDNETICCAPMCMEFYATSCPSGWKLHESIFPGSIHTLSTSMQALESVIKSCCPDAQFHDTSVAGVSEDCYVAALLWTFPGAGNTSVTGAGNTSATGTANTSAQARRLQHASVNSTWHAGFTPPPVCENITSNTTVTPDCKETMWDMLGSWDVGCPSLVAGIFGCVIMEAVL